MAMISILCATNEELSRLTETFVPDNTVTINGSVFYKHNDIIYAQTGIGKVNAAITATTMLCRFPEITSLIFTGVSGGLRELPNGTIGQIVLGSSFVQADIGVFSNGTFTDTLTDIVPIEIPVTVSAMVSQTLHDLQTITTNTHVGGIVTADYFLADAEHRDFLAQKYDALAFDMESAAVFAVTERFGVPAYIIRTLSDMAGDEASVSYNEMAYITAKNSVEIAQSLIDLIS